MTSPTKKWERADDSVFIIALTSIPFIIVRMKHILENLENRLQKLVEASIGFFPWNQPQKTVAIRIINELRAKVSFLAESGQPIPNVFITQVNPEVYHALMSEPVWIEDIKKVLYETAFESGLSFAGPIHFELVPVNQYRVDEFNLQYNSNLHEIERTSVMKVTPVNEIEQETIKKRAFLILKNNEIYNLEQGIIQIGRKRENHLMIDSPHISRAHAQIRLIADQYMIFDLNSTGGTYLNGNRITQAPLRAGDVISLAGYDLVYGEENQIVSPDEEQTAKLPKIVDGL